MAKRLTDTEKWKDDWYQSLTNDYRIIWQYLLDNCNHAGLMKRNMRLLNFHCKTEITEETLLEIFKNRIYVSGEYYFIPKFIKFQYGNLESDKPVIVSVIKLLQSHNDYAMIKELLANNCVIVKSKSKDKSKSKSLFKNSEFFDKENFKKAFYSNPKYQKYNYEHYYEAVKNWSASGGNMKSDWIATAYTWARNDKSPHLVENANWK